MPRPIREWRSASIDNYNEFCQRNPKIEISYATFRKIIYTWNDLFAKHILDTGQKVKMAWGLGPLTINRYKRNSYRTSKAGNKVVNLGIDWKETKKEGKYVYHLNAQTNGFRYYWYWNPYDSYIKTPYIWKLEMARVHSRSLAAILKRPDDNRKDLYRQWIFRKI